MLSARNVTTVVRSSATLAQLEDHIKYKLKAMPKTTQVRQMCIIQRYYQILSLNMSEDAAKRCTFETWIKKHVR